MPIKGRKEFSDDLHARANKFCRALTLETHKRLVDMTPVDTGRARANWNVATGMFDASNNPTLTVADVESKRMEGIRVIGQFKAGEILYVTNSLPYIPALEDGHSKQAPAGMVKITSAQMKQFAAKAAQSVRITGGTFTTDGL